MEKNENKKKDWIKNAIIIFLAIMLILTLFSNTITNMSLPQVSTAQVVEGTITETVRGSGKVEADPYTIKATETRTIASMIVSKGDHVEIGDTICELADTNSDELTKAQTELDELENKYLTKMFESGVTSDTITKARSGNYDSLSTMQAKVADVEQRIEEAQTLVNNYQNQVYVETILKAFADKNIDVETFGATEAKALIDAEVTKLGLGNVTDENVAKALKEAKEKQADLAAASTIATANATLEKEKTTTTEKNAETLLATAQASLKALQTEQEALTKDLAAEIALEGYAESIEKKRAEVEKLEAKAYGATITAPVAGTIQSVAYVSGEKMESGKDVCVIIPDGKAMTLKITVTADQAKKLNVGDTADVDNAWSYQDANIVLKSITDDTDNPGKNSILTFTVEGSNITVGQSLSISVGTGETTYKTVVPKSALYSDNSGTYVYVLVTKSSPLGNRYIAERRKVEKKKEDDNKVGIEGDVQAYDYVISGSNKMIEAGKQVRLSESNAG